MKHAPPDESGLVVHRGKIEEVTTALREGVRLLLLSGPPGSGKATVLRCVAKSLGYSVLEFADRARAQKICGSGAGELTQLAWSPRR